MATTEKPQTTKKARGMGAIYSLGLGYTCRVMPKPRGHHFLPKEAHLRFFQTPDRPGYVWQYRRGKEPFPSNIEKAGKENDLKESVRFMLSRPGAIEALLEKQKRENPGKFDCITPDLARELLAGNLEFRLNHEYKLAQSLKLSKIAFEELTVKRLALLRADREFFITGDDPVVFGPRPEVPAQIRYGFRWADVFVPCGVPSSSVSGTSRAGSRASAAPSF